MYSSLHNTFTAVWNDGSNHYDIYFGQRDEKTIDNHLGFCKKKSEDMKFMVANLRLSPAQLNELSEFTAILCGIPKQKKRFGLTTQVLLNALRLYLPAVTVEQLYILSGTPRSITICCAVQDIIKEYNSTPAKESLVAELLSDILKNHFNDEH